MEMDMEIGNYSDESTISDDSGDSFSPRLKRLCKDSTDTTLTAADADVDTDSKTSSTRSSLSEEFGEPLLSEQPFDPLHAVVSSGGTGDSFSPPLKRLCKDSTDTTTTAAADDTHGKTSSLTRTSTTATADADAAVDTDNKTSSGEEIGKRRYSTLEEYLTNNEYSWEECKDFLMTIDRRPKLDSQSEIETWRVDPSRLYCYAEQALEYVQEMKGEDYIYLGPRSMCLCSFPDSEYKITHINFFARRHGETLDSLLFAALEHGPVRKVVDCCSVPLFKAGDGVVPCIKHPPEVDCSECSKFGDAALCFEVEEEACCLSWSSWPPA